MTYPRWQRGFATHKKCAYFSGGFCTLNGVMVGSDQPACPNFQPKDTTITSETRTPHKRPRQLFQVPLLHKPPSLVRPDDPEDAYTLVQQLTPQRGYSISQQRGVYLMSRSRAGGRGGVEGRGRGRMGGFATGAGGSCVCPSCGYTKHHRRGTPCFQQKCPKCRTPMIRRR